MRSMTSSSENSQLAFHRLDPILRMLLTSIEQYRECTGIGSPPETLLDEEERILGLLRAQVKMMEHLETAMRDVVETYGPGALVPLTVYILLPLRLLLQSSEWNGNGSNIRQSAVWRSVEAATHALKSFVLLLASLPAKQTVDCLVACTLALPTEAILSKTKGLDRGDDCLCAILHCINTLLNSADYQQEIAAALDGDLVARIAYACITLISPQNSRGPEVKLQAIQTLGSLMNAVPLAKLWQSYFPACFAGLCGFVLSELNLSAAQASPKVSSEACRTLSRLLRLTLSVKHENSKTMDALQRIRQLAISDTSTQESSEFYNEIHSRLPALLILLMNLLPTASSPKLRQAATELCRAILVETHSMWNQKETSNVLRAAIECCITLSRDKGERAVSSSKSVIADYQRASGGYHMDSVVGPRIIELIQELPTLARSGRELELRAKINLICGYLTLGVPLRSSLMSVANEIRTSLAGVFDVDFNSIQYAPRVSLTEDLWNVPDQCRFRFLTDDTAESARHMVRLLGEAVGPKGASTLVDDCIADVLEACTAVSHSLSGSRQVDWLHQWIGFIIIAHEILVGAFTESSPDDGHVRAGRESDRDVSPSRENRTRMRRLHSLAGAILPIITSDPLWNLPTVLDNVDQKSSIERMPAASTQNLIQSGTLDDSFANTVSASALKGNAALVCSLIGIVSVTVDLLSKDAELFLPVILYPLCEKASSKNHSQVQHSATISLHQVALACSKVGSIQDLVRQNFDYLFAAMLSRIRLSFCHQGRDQPGYPTSVPSIVQIILRSAVDKDGAGDDAIPIQRSLSNETCVSYVIELVNALVASFDRNLVTFKTNVELQSSTALDLVQVFDAALSFVASTFGFNLDHKKELHTTADVPEATEEWLALLDPFRTRKGPNDDLGDLTAREGFERIRKMRVGQSNETNNHPCIEITNGELDFVNLVLARCSFFLSSPSLHVQIASCVTMQHSFLLLGYIAMYTKSREDECNGPSTAILRHISGSWPSIISRLRSLSSVVTRSPSVKTVSLRSLQSSAPEKSQDTSSQISFLLKLFELIACTCEVSGDFMVTRIEEEVWPIVAKVLDLYVREKQSTHHLSGDSVRSHELIRKTSFPTVREKLLHAVLEFLSRVYGVRKCGRGLSGLIPVAGTLVLPFLADEGELRIEAMTAVKVMLKIDCDALWRPLLQLSHRRITTRTLHPRLAVVGASDEPECATPLELAAAELVDFIEALPEQSFEV